MEKNAQETRETVLINMKKMFYFPFNINSYTLIKEIWEDDPYLMKHLQEKYVDYNNVMEFFCNLDADNQKKFLEYILDNYHGIKKL